MAAIITVDEIPSGIASMVDPALLTIMVGGANARASRVAPCLNDASPEQLAEAKLILLGAVSRWAQAGTGSFVQQSAGPFQVSTDTRQRGGYNLWPSEINQLIDLCGSISRSAFAVDTVPQSAPCEPDWWFEVGNTSGPSLDTAVPE